MKRTMNRFLPVVFAGMFLYAGCAKQEIVKKDEPISPAAAKPAATAPQKPTTSNTMTQPLSQQKPQQATVPATTADMRKALEKIYFDFDSSTLNTTARQTLTKNFEALKQNPQAKIRVEGNCDERGSDEYNLALGEQRAKEAVRYLTTLGVPAERLTFISYGKEKPVDSGHNEAAWAKNRRDEFVVSQ
ncbi:peptidoglycan-associated lipoprotein Pal [Geobacter sp. AOG1]|uniref:peptidoglycan-associated lipoprotein Pal n=1 Tax=Geobacter sp. AOG1 TaxID=1566346 RepID=UPI001CC6E547|nr:peptidoglycan-associated lipoprotein Pal [Geobacter sp. AOG1]GFE56658.1 peptidoglycan-associated lipoprotein [Geobacter sp. AOG1]